MAKRILVPLDETVQAESMVEAVAAQSRGTGAFVRLLHVAPTPEAVFDEDGRVIAYSDQAAARFEAAALDYLRTMEIAFDGVQVECTVRFGDPVTQILEEAEAWNADLIAMATRGRACIGRALLGSVAEQVFRKASTAVTLYRAGRERAA
jgi:nucleotide-binding universal stress UspA family protein